MSITGFFLQNTSTDQESYFCKKGYVCLIGACTLSPKTSLSVLNPKTLFKLKLKNKMKKRLKTNSNFKTSSFSFGFLLLLLVCSFTANAQSGTVTGMVTNGKGLPLPGVNVIQKGTSNGAATDFDGMYTINIQGGKSDVLVFYYLGYKTQELTVGSKTKIDVSLVEDTDELDEVVVIGYGEVQKADVTGAVGSVKSAELTQIAPVDALDGLQGRVSGVQITTAGSPGSESEILIRGISTFGAGTAPLYIVDGQQVDNITNLNPADIESMDILKDGASAAIYGSRSVNGVVLITTKQGQVGFPKVVVDYISSINFVNAKIPTSNTRQRNVYTSLRLGNTDNSGVVRDSLGIRSTLVVDAQDAILQLGLKNQLNLSFSGGGEKSKFYWSTGYLKETGVIVASGNTRITSNLKVDFDLNKYLTAGTRINSSYQLTDGLSEFAALSVVSHRQSDILLRDYDGEFIPEAGGRANPLARAILADNDNRTFRTSFFNYLNFNITPSLAFKTTLGVNYNNRKQNTFRPQATVNIDNGRINGRERLTTDYNFQNENFFNYNKKFKGGHRVKGLLGMSVQKWQVEASSIGATEFNNDLVPTFNNVTELNASQTFTTETSHALSSVFSRLSYDYKRKYFISGSIRRDGSSRFGKNKRWGNFPAIQGGWEIAKEGFMKSFRSLNNLKLRASYAITGNERIDNFESLALYTPGFFYNGFNGLALNRLGNEDLGWEETAQQNYGIDISLFKRRLNITADRYIKTTTDLLIELPIPQETGFSNIRINAGSVENKGWELNINGKIIKTDNFTWTSNFNISKNENKVLSLPNGKGFQPTDNQGNNQPYLIEEGQPLGNIFGYRNLGVFQYDESNAYTPEGVQLTPNFDANNQFVNYTLNGQEYTDTPEQLKFNNVVLRGGDIIFEDQNKDFNIDAENDQTVLGNGLPDYVGGFNNKFDYKNFSFSFQFNYNFGNDIYRLYDHTRDKRGNSVVTPSPSRIDGAWINQGDITKYPSLLSSRVNNRTGFESNYVSQGDYIRLRNIRFSYNLPKETIEKLGVVNKLTVSANINNLLTFTNYEGYNPELRLRGDVFTPGLDNLRFPNKTEIIIGLNVHF